VDGIDHALNTAQLGPTVECIASQLIGAWTLMAHTDEREGCKDTHPFACTGANRTFEACRVGHDSRLSRRHFFCPTDETPGRTSLTQAKFAASSVLPWPLHFAT